MRSMIFSLTLCLAASTSAHAAPAQPTLDACSFLDQKTAASLYGAPVGAGKNEGAAAAGMAICMYYDQKKSEAASLLIQTLPAGMEKIMLDSITKGTPTTRVTAVTGLGDHAVYTNDGKAISLAVFNHGKLIVLGITGADTPIRRAAMLPLVRQIITKL